MHNAGHNLANARSSTDASISRATKQSGRPLLNHRQQQHHLRGDDRERTASARQAAEALFTPKRQPVEPSASDSAPSTEHPARKPRVLAILSPAPVRNEEAAAPVTPEPRTARHIPRSEHARIRTLVNYGMTISQVARVYGVAVGLIERILR
jgi:hypothetical protein